MENSQVPKSRGRPAGSPNKFTREMKEAFQAAFDSLQEKDGVNLIDWASDNPTDFYKIVAKMIPQNLELTGGEGGPIVLQGVDWNIVSPKD